MKAYFNGDKGIIFDLFTSLFEAYNFDFYLEEHKKFGIEPVEDVVSALTEIRESFDFKRDSLRLIENKEIDLFEIYVKYNELWKAETLDEYLNNLMEISEDEFKRRLIDCIFSFKGENLSSEELDNKMDALRENRDYFELIKNLNISSEIKWDLTCFLNDIKGHIKDFIKDMESYSNLFLKVYKKYQINLNEVKNLLKKRIEDNNLDFLRDLGVDVLNSEDNLNNCYFTISYFSNLSLNMSIKKEEGNVYIILGKDFEKIALKLKRSGKLDKSLLIFKNLSDKSRYEMVKLLSEGESYGQELAEKLGITTATVSYHSSNLLLSDIIKVERRDRRVYYILNKDEIARAIEFLKNDLNL